MDPRQIDRAPLSPFEGVKASRTSSNSFTTPKDVRLHHQPRTLWVTLLLLLLPPSHFDFLFVILYHQAHDFRGEWLQTLHTLILNDKESHMVASFLRFVLAFAYLLMKMSGLQRPSRSSVDPNVCPPPQFDFFYYTEG